MYGDNAHKRLLDEGWLWDGVQYTLSMRFNLFTLTLKLAPEFDPHAAIAVLRKHSWVLLINGEQLGIAHKNLNNAARAVLGDD